MKKLALLLTAMAVTMLYSSTALAADAASGSDYMGYVGLGAGLAIGLGALGGGIGQGIAAKAALDGIARNPDAADKLNTPMIIGLALIESLVIYALVVGVLLIGKIA